MNPAANPAPEQAPDPPGPAGATPVGSPPAARLFTAIRSWHVVRGEDRWFAGVCGGVATRLGVDPLVVRGVLLALTVVGGLGLAVYGTCWLLLPDGRDRIEAEAALRGDVSGALALSVALVAADLAVDRGVAGIGWGGWGDGPGWGFLITGLVATLTWWLVRDQPFPRRLDPTAASAPAPTSTAALSLREAAPALSLRTDEPAPSPAPVPAPPSPLPAAGFGSPAERRAAARLKAQESAARARARRRPGSPLQTAAVTGSSLLVAGAVVVAGLLDLLPGRTVPLALCAALLVLGTGAVVAGLRGRRTALLGLAVPVALCAACTSLLPTATGWRWEVDQTWAPTTASVREAPALSAAVGRLGVDPSGLVAAGTTRPGDRTTATATIAAGRLDVEVPTDGVVLVAATALTGSVRWEESADVVAVDADPTVREDARAGGFDVRRFFLVGPDAAAAAEGTSARGDDVDDWTLPSGTPVLLAGTWAGEVRVGAADGALLSGE